MIVGVGHDMVEIARVARLLNQPSGTKFAARILTEAERAVAAQRPGRVAEFVAGRFAAKEAVAKALGCGIGRSVGFHDMEILPGLSGKPECRLSEAAWERLGFLKQDAVQIHLSITHTQTVAGAFAVVER